MNHKLLDEKVELSSLTKTEIAKRVGISRTTLDNVLAGEATTRVVHVEQICNIIGLQPSVLFDGRQGHHVTGDGNNFGDGDIDITIGADAQTTKLLLRIAELEGDLKAATAKAEERERIIGILSGK